MEALTGQILEAVFTILGAVIAALAGWIVPKIKRWLDIASDADNLGIIEAITDWAVEYAEEEFAGEEGKKKFNHAANYAAKLLNNYGIEASDELIKTSIQKGYNNMVMEGKEKEKRTDQSQ